MNAFLRFLGENKIWWIAPIVIVLALVAYVVWTGGDQGGTPFSYDHY